MESDADKKREFERMISTLSASKLVYVDESGIEMSMQKAYGWGMKGDKLMAQKSGKYFQRQNIIAGLKNGKAVAPGIYSCTCNAEVFNTWLEESLLKALEPGDIIILDNVSFHKTQKTAELIEKAGCLLIFLPPYSPKLNPIETFWANMKKWIKQNLDIFDNINDTIQGFFKLAKYN